MGQESLCSVRRFVLRLRHEGKVVLERNLKLCRSARVYVRKLGEASRNETTQGFRWRGWRSRRSWRSRTSLSSEYATCEGQGARMEGESTFKGSLCEGVLEDNNLPETSDSVERKAVCGRWRGGALARAAVRMRPMTLRCIGTGAVSGRERFRPHLRVDALESG